MYKYTCDAYTFDLYTYARMRLSCVAIAPANLYAVTLVAYFFFEVCETERAKRKMGGK